ncbi:unnamed protein product [Clonostachys rosea]|uniref:Uncharacterized protein n=1 Tax=Bionectria ochroleuca TaxID=29856 RepID=A0ABY6UCX4_BIOOC|nr:unnamed protein product [Clonostachys rosea]
MPLITATLGLEEGLKEQLKEDEGRRAGRRRVAILKDVRKDLGRLDGVVVHDGDDEGTVEREKVKIERERKLVPGKLRYFEGIPLREWEKGEELTGWDKWEIRDKRKCVVVPEGAEEKCLQCRVRNLRCTLTKKLVVPRGDDVWREGPCWRCIRHGDADECLVKTGPAGWQFAMKDFTVLPYDPTADFNARVTKKQEVVIYNFKDEGRMQEIMDRWTEQDEKVVVDTIANHTDAKELEPYTFKKKEEEEEEEEDHS